MKSRLLKISSILIAGLIFVGCAGAGYQTAPSNLENATKEIKIENDKFKNMTVISTPAYLIRKGFTDTFPVIMSLKAGKDKDVYKFIKIELKIADVSSGMYYEAVGEDGYNFSFKEIDANEIVSSVKTTTVTNNYAHSNTLIIKQDYIELYLTVEQLKKMLEKDYDIKIYGKKKEGVFSIPKHITEAFYNKLIK